MIEILQFYTKNVLHFLVFMLIGFTIAILDISIRKVVKNIYLNVRYNKPLMDSDGDNTGEVLREGLTDSNDASAVGDESCPKDCAAVAELRKRLTDLITDATKLKADVNQNKAIIQSQQMTIEMLKINVQELTAAK
jgi:hypothetical protein